MRDFLDVSARNAKRTVESGYYQAEMVEHTRRSLKDGIVNCKANPIISEIKISSPTRDVARGDVDVADTASAMKRGGAAGISVITEPKYFKGSLRNFKLVRERVPLPLLMKDFVVSQAQVEAASKIGADTILLIQAFFDRDYCDRSLEEMIEHAHSYEIEVLLEVHTAEEFQSALQSNADLIGINNRNLKTLTLDIRVTEEILKRHCPHEKIVVSESGIASPSHIRFLRGAGAKAFLVGTAVMSAHNVEEKVRELVEA